MMLNQSQRLPINRSAPKKRSRKEILRIASAMADELVGRADDATTPRVEARALLRSAQILRELMSIANGTRSAAYWTRRPRVTPSGPLLSKAFPLS